MTGKIGTSKIAANIRRGLEEALAYAEGTGIGSRAAAYPRVPPAPTSSLSTVIRRRFRRHCERHDDRRQGACPALFRVGGEGGIRTHVSGNPTI
jgi:hypothetical protein